MAVLRMRDGDSLEVREEYRDASTKFGNALHNGLLLELTVDEPGHYGPDGHLAAVKVTVNPAAIALIRP